jgi:hypothetical protein
MTRPSAALLVSDDRRVTIKGGRVLTASIASPSKASEQTASRCAGARNSAAVDRDDDVGNSSVTGRSSGCGALEEKRELFEWSSNFLMVSAGSSVESGTPSLYRFRSRHSRFLADCSEIASNN